MTVFYNSFLLSKNKNEIIKVQRNKMRKLSNKWYLISPNLNLREHIKDNASLKIDISRMTTTQKDELSIQLSLYVKSLDNVYFHLQKESDLNFLDKLSIKINKLNLTGTQRLLNQAVKVLKKSNFQSVSFKITGSSYQLDWIKLEEDPSKEANKLNDFPFKEANKLIEFKNSLKNQDDNFVTSGFGENYIKPHQNSNEQYLSLDTIYGKYYQEVINIDTYSDDDQKQIPRVSLDNPEAKRLIKFKDGVNPVLPSYERRFERITYFDNSQSETPSCIDTSNAQNQKVNHNNSTNSDKSSYDENLFIEIII